MDYNGVIIEESLEDPTILQKLQVISTRVSPVTDRHKTPWIKQWTLHTVAIIAQQADEVAEGLSQVLDGRHAWYTDFSNSLFHFIIYKNRIFRVMFSDPLRPNRSDYKEAIEYGLSLGIPEYQLDFGDE